MIEHSGMLRGEGRRFGIVIGRFNELVTRQLLVGARDCLVRHGVADDDIEALWVPGAFEIPIVVRELALQKRGDAIIAIGVIIGRTAEYFDFFVYAIASVVVFPKVFFPFAQPLTATLYSFAVFALAFVARPIGSLIFTAVDRRHGRGVGTRRRHAAAAAYRHDLCRPRARARRGRGRRVDARRPPRTDLVGARQSASAGPDRGSPGISS